MSRLSRAALTLAAACFICSAASAQQSEDEARHKSPLPSDAAARCTESPAGRSVQLLCPIPTLTFDDADDASIPPPVQIDLKLPEGTPLRIAIDQRTRVRRVGEPVLGHVVESVYSFDEAVIPAGSLVMGHVTQVDPIPKVFLVRAYASGNFSPTRKYQVTFDQLMLPTGEALDIETTVDSGSADVVHLVAKQTKKDEDQNERKTMAGRAVVAAGEEMKEGIHQAGVTAQHAADEIRSPGKMQRVKVWLLNQSPYRRQYVAVGTRFNAVLNHELDFGSGSRTREELSNLGSVPPVDSILHARLVLEVSSATATRGAPVVAQLTEPL